MRNENELGAIIRNLRGNISLRDFAVKCDISHTTIDNLEKGFDFRTGKPVQAKMATLKKIADACNVSVGYLLGEEEKPTANDGELSDNRKKLMEFANSVPEDKVDLLLRVMQSIVEADQ